jgi:hypothetical protein
MAYNPPDYGGYERQAGDVNYQYSRDAATNAYGRFLSQQRGERSLYDQSQQFGRQLPGYTASFGQRGLSGGGINSGAMRQSMGNYIGDYATQYGRTQQDTTNELQQYDLSQLNLDEWRQQQLAAIQAQKANDIANTASNLEYIRQLVGGL